MTCHRVPNGIVCLGGPIYRILVGKRYVTFEDHRLFGPVRCHPNGEVQDRQFPERSPFWPVWERWVEQGKRVDELGRAIVEQNE